MKDLIDFALKEKYEKVKKLKSNLEEIKILVDWDSVAKLIPKNENNTGRPPYKTKLMIKILFLRPLLYET